MVDIPQDSDGDNGEDFGRNSGHFTWDYHVTVWGSGAGLGSSLRGWGTSYGSGYRGGHGIAVANHDVRYFDDKHKSRTLAEIADGGAGPSVKIVAYDPNSQLPDRTNSTPEQIKAAEDVITKTNADLHALVGGKNIFARIDVAPATFETDIPVLMEKYSKLGFDGISIKNSADFPTSKLEQILRISNQAMLANGKTAEQAALHLEPANEEQLAAYLTILEKKTVAAVEARDGQPAVPEQKGNEDLLAAVKNGVIEFDQASSLKDPTILDKLVALGVRVIDNETSALSYGDAEKFAKQHRGVELIRENDPPAPAGQRPVAYDTNSAAEWLATHDGSGSYSQCRQYVLDAMAYGSHSGIAQMIRDASSTTGANAVYDLFRSDQRLPGLEKTRYQDLFINVAEGHGATVTHDNAVQKGDTVWWQGAANGHAMMAIEDASGVATKGIFKFDMPLGEYSNWTGLKEPESLGDFMVVRPAKWDQLKPEVQADLRAHPEVMASLGFDPDAAVSPVAAAAAKLGAPVIADAAAFTSNGPFTNMGAATDKDEASVRRGHFSDLQDAWSKHTEGAKPDVSMNGQRMSWQQAAQLIRDEPDIRKKLELTNNAINATVMYGGSYDATRNLPGGHWISTPYDAVTRPNGYEHAICGDIAAAKLFMLRDAGIEAQQLALVTIGPGSGYGEYHVVPAVQFKKADGTTTEAVMELNRRQGGSGYVTTTDEVGSDKFGTLARPIERVIPLVGSPTAVASETHFYYKPNVPGTYAVNMGNYPGSLGNTEFAGYVEDAILNAATATGLNVQALRQFVKIESSGNPRDVTGSYMGLLQLSSEEFSKNGGGNIFNASDNAMAGARKLKNEALDFKEKYGHLPNVAELYLIHQQGSGGARAHWANPNAPAWENMWSTAEGQQKGPGWAKKAIWGNVPDNLKAEYGSVEQMTSRQFVEMWAMKTGTAPIFADQPAESTVTASTTTSTKTVTATTTPPLPPVDSEMAAGLRRQGLTALKSVQAAEEAAKRAISDAEAAKQKFAEEVAKKKAAEQKSASASAPSAQAG